MYVLLQEPYQKPVNISPPSRDALLLFFNPHFEIHGVALMVHPKTLPSYREGAQASAQRGFQGPGHTTLQ